MMAAISSKIHNPNGDVILVERNNKLGIKLRLTGGGRCNVTADVTNQEVIANTPKNGKFLFSSLSNFNPSQIKDFFEKEGCPLKVEDHGRVFPKSNKSIDIIKVLIVKMKKLNIDIRLNTYVSSVNYEKKLIYTNNGDIGYNHLIIATGGKTYPATGSDGNGYDLVSKIGHSITDLVPGEVPLVSNDKCIQSKALQGLSFKDVRIDIMNNNKIKQKIKHDLIFTHFGISGPVALRASFYIQELLKRKKEVLIYIDFIPSIDINTLEAHSDNLEEYIMSLGIPKRLITYINDEFQNDLINKIKKFPLSIYSTRGFSQAFVTNGGISTKEIDPKTMKSKLINSVSFCGEIIDVSSFTGGYNITSAFSTGYTAGKYALK